MFFQTEDMDKANEDLDIPFLLSTQHRGIFPPLLLYYIRDLANPL